MRTTKREPVLHYAGALRWTNRRNMTTDVLAGWAACCSGRRAVEIRAAKQHTYDVGAVTCGACLRAMERAGVRPTPPDASDCAPPRLVRTP